MGMQVSRSVDTEVSEEDIIRGIAEVFGFNVQGTRNAEGVSGDRGASFARSYPHIDFDTTEVCGFSSSRLLER